MVNVKKYLRSYFQVALHKHVKRVRHYALGGILYRHNSVVRPPLFNLAENVVYCFAMKILAFFPEFLEGGLVRERSLKSEIRYSHRPEHSPVYLEYRAHYQRDVFPGQRTLVAACKIFYYLLFPGRIKGGQLLQIFYFRHLPDLFGAKVQKVND